jgi:hypothetical protein
MKRSLSVLLSICAVAPITVLNAAVVTSVPMQGAMVHVSLAYDAAQNSVVAHVDPVVPELKPLDISNPTDQFSAADPWYSYLDSSQQGLAFNRQYGFVPDALTDPLPQGTGIWIRNLSLTPGITAFRYRSTDPKAWEPMFGCGGSSTVWQWNMAMFHPAMAAPALAGTHSGVFEAFLVDLQTGQPVPGVATATFELDWTVAASARPALTLERKIQLRWPSSATNYVLQTAAALDATTWTTVTNTPVVSDGNNAVILDEAVGHCFFRLVRTP